MIFSEHEFPYAAARETELKNHQLIPRDVPEVVEEDDIEVGEVVPVTDRGSLNGDGATRDAESDPVPADTAELGRGHRRPIKSVRLTDYVTYSVRCAATTPPHTHSSSFQLKVLRYGLISVGELCDVCSFYRKISCFFGQARFTN